jgi:hypothetical protein
MEADDAFKLELFIPEGYPICPPRVHFLDKIDHPRVDKDGQICLGILQDDWSPAFRLCGVLVSIRALLLSKKSDENPSVTDSPNVSSAQALPQREGAGYGIIGIPGPGSYGAEVRPARMSPSVLKVRPLTPESKREGGKSTYAHIIQEGAHHVWHA